MVSAAGFFGLVPADWQPILAAVAHIFGVVVIAMNSVRMAGGTVRKAPAAAKPPEEELPRKKKYEDDADFAAPKLTPLKGGLSFE